MTYYQLWCFVVTVTIRAALEQRIKRDKRVFSLLQFDRAAQRNLIANPSEQRAPNSNFAPWRAVGATYFFWQVRRGATGAPDRP
ncbi:hypothetical protein EDB89DRAFT_1989972, partial [Lactarius sanguifluus]